MKSVTANAPVSCAVGFSSAVPVRLNPGSFARVMLMLVLVLTCHPAGADAMHGNHLVPKLAVPLFFAPLGPENGSVGFTARGPAHEFTIGARHADFALLAHTPGPSSAPTSGTLSFQFLGSSESCTAEGGDPLRARVNQFSGNSSEWRTGVPAFGSVCVSNLYPGIDLVYYGSDRELEYDLVVAPGADPSQVEIRLAGADRMLVDAQGDLVIGIGDRQIVQRRPLAYQTQNGTRKHVRSGYTLRQGGVVGFELGAYDCNLPLVIDPVLSYSSYFGGPGPEAARAIALDSVGNVYIAGETLSGTLGTGNAFQPVFGGAYLGGGGDAFVAKFDPTGESLIYFTYLGGNGQDSATAISVGPNGLLYVAGMTDSTNFPLTGASLSTSIGGKGEFYFDLHALDSFLAKLSPDGSELVYSTYLGGEGEDICLDMAVDGDGAAVLVGSTDSKKFPATLPPLGEELKPRDAFIAKISPDGSSLIFARLFGGTQADYAEGVVIDPEHRCYVVGYSLSTNFPVTAGASQTFNSGRFSQAFVSAFDVDGALTASTYLGSDMGDTRAFRVALGQEGQVYVVGAAAGGAFPIFPGVFNPGGVYASTTGGVFWNSANAGLSHVQVHGLAMDPSNPDVLYLSTGRGVYMSTNGAASWVVVLDTSAPYPAIAVNRSTPSTVYAGGLQIIKSQDRGQTWAVLKDTSDEQVNDIVIDPFNSSVIYAGTERGILKSTDAGLKWASSNKGLAQSPVRSLVADAAEPGLLYAALDSGVYQSVNNGANWTAINEGMTNGFPSALVLGEGDSGVLYAGTRSGAILVKPTGTDVWNGLGFVTTSALPIHDLAVDPARPATLYAGTSVGVYKSVDAGLTWSAATNGLRGLPVLKLAVSPRDTGVVYAGTYGLAGAGMADAFITSYVRDLTRITSSMVIAGGQDDQAQDVVVAGDGTVYVAGYTASGNFPEVDPVAPGGHRGLADAFFAAVDPHTGALLTSSVLGGSSSDYGTGLALNGSGALFLVGQTWSRDFPVNRPISPQLSGSADAFVARVDATVAPVEVTLLTVPGGLSLVVDGVTVQTPAVLSWPAGSFHSLYAAPVSVEKGVRYAFSGWGDNLAGVVRQYIATNSTTLAATFRLQYELTMMATNPTITDPVTAIRASSAGAFYPGSGWYDAGTTLRIRMVPPYENTFIEWLGSGAGSYSGTDNVASVTITGPVSQVAVVTGPFDNILRVNINGEGSLDPNRDGKKLKVGTVYTMTAKPRSGNVFSNWTGDVLSSNPKLSFVMQQGMVLEANFAPNPYGPLKGTYAGLFSDPYLFEAQSSGFCTVSLSDSGKASGKMQLAGRNYSFSGKFTAEGRLALSLLRGNLPSVQILLSIDPTGAIPGITGTFSSGTWSSHYAGHKQTFSSANPPPQAGRKFTIVFPGPGPSIGQPSGDGYGTVWIDKSGNVSFSGVMADGRKVTQKTFLSAENDWPLFASMHEGVAALGGNLKISSSSDGALAGVYHWHKGATPGSDTYSGGFNISAPVQASQFVSANGQPVLELNNGAGLLRLENAGLTEPIQVEFTLSANNKVSFGGGQNVSLSFNTSGLYSGSFKDPATGKSIKFGGAVLQNVNRGAGSFVRDHQAGRSRIVPAGVDGLE